MTINIIDTHAQVVLGKAFGKAGKYGPDTGVDKDGVPQQKCDESWSMDNIRVRVVKYQ